MSLSPKRLVAGNWKMNGLKGDLGEISTLAQMVTADVAASVDVAICPPATLLSLAGAAVAEAPLALGAQDCHAAVKGAHTGDISAEMLVEARARYIIVGHSERRADHHETDEMVKAKAEAVQRAGAAPIVCVGETLDEREAGKTLEVIAGQVSGSMPLDGPVAELVVAYEPVWAIGTGLTPTLEQIEEVHTAIRRQLLDKFGARAAQARILYGGSMKPDNAADILTVTDVDGGLVGGASLKAESFFQIVRAAVEAR